MSVVKYTLIFVMLFAVHQHSFSQVADKETYLSSLKAEFVKKWPDNRTINIVFHGHSVPTGYSQSPIVQSLNAYPQLTLTGLKSKYPYLVVNIITTSIGGENAESGVKRMDRDVLRHSPDVLLIDYALNDRNIGVDRARKAWTKMIEMAIKKNIKVILFTSTPDLDDKNHVLDDYAKMIRQLASDYHVGLVDSYKLFMDKAAKGDDLSKFMSQSNHPNIAGHYLVASELLTWFF